MKGTSVKQVFISHAIEDADFAQRLADDLKHLGVRVWIAPDSILPGEEWVDAIERGLRESNHVVMVLTPAALEASGVKMERDMAITLALQDRIEVISLRVKPCEVPLVLSRYQMILAFQKDYDAGLNQLAGRLGLRVAPPEPEEEKKPKPPGRRPLRLLPFALAGLLLLAICVAAIALITGAGGPPPVSTTISAPSNASLYDTWIRPTDNMEMVYVPGGTFEMGSDDGQNDEQPVHRITLDSFWIDRTEITNAQFARFVLAPVMRDTYYPYYRTDADKAGTGVVYSDGSWNVVDGADWQHPNGPDTSISDRMDHPVVQVSWNDATTYCEWAGGRLPTEAEWEYAARGPDGSIYPWGNDPPNDTLANYWPNVRDTTEVGSYPDGASWVGAVDIAGNVQEWVDDWYDGYPGTTYQIDDFGTTHKVLRGGSWGVIEEYIRAAVRYDADPVGRSGIFGFRCVAEPDN